MENLTANEVLRQVQKDPLNLILRERGKAKLRRELDEGILYNTMNPDVTGYSVTDYAFKASVDYAKAVKALEELGWKQDRSNRSYVTHEKTMVTTMALFVHGKHMLYLGAASINSTHARLLKPLEEETATADEPTKSILAINEAYVLHPSFEEEGYDQKLIVKTGDMLGLYVLEETDESRIGMIVASDGEYYVKIFSLADKVPVLQETDLHYGAGFQDFSDALLGRIERETKGLVLFHGDPGTGKTYYIRWLLNQLSKMNKSVLYAPPSLSENLTDPAMIDFISNWILDEDRDCILLIEDAEPLLESRKNGGGRTSGISNLLNITDGILNDILGLMVIATFNTDIDAIDTALLRPERLIARKCFTPIPKERGVQLADKMGIDVSDVKWPASTADLYSRKKKNQILTHELNEERKPIGFKRT